MSDSIHVDPFLFVKQLRLQDDAQSTYTLPSGHHFVLTKGVVVIVTVVSVVLKVNVVLGVVVEGQYMKHNSVSSS